MHDGKTTGRTVYLYTGGSGAVGGKDGMLMKP